VELPWWCGVNEPPLWCGVAIICAP
jgi:hypothetical protein